MMDEPNKKPDTAPQLSIVIRTRNEGQGLQRIFDALAAQQCSFKWEVVVVDNESEDDTLDLCTTRGARVVKIRRDEFTYGRALNLGISHARGEFILTLSAHALPIGSRFLEECARPLADSAIAAVRCLGVTDRKKLMEWYRLPDIYYTSTAEQSAAESSRQWTRHYPAATCCVIRRSVWEEIRFDESLEAVEDKLWASQVLRRGYKIRSCAEAMYLRTDELKERELWKKQSREFRELHRVRGYVPLSWGGFLRAIVRAVLTAPIVAVRHVTDSFVKNLDLVLVPRRARLPRISGSLPDFEKKDLSSDAS